MNNSYHKLIADLEKAINALDADLFDDRQRTGKVEFWEAHEYCKTLSHYKSAIMDQLIKVGALKH